MLFMQGTPDFPQCGFPAQTVKVLQALGADFKPVNIFGEPELREAGIRPANSRAQAGQFCIGEIY